MSCSFIESHNYYENSLWEDQKNVGTALILDPKIYKVKDKHYTNYEYFSS